MFGSICPIGNSDIWLQQTSTKTGREFIVGCVPRSPHGCFLSTGQASRKFHRSIAGDFDHTLFAPDFLEHEFLHLSDLLLSPPAFMASVAALIRTGVYLALEKKSDGAKTQQESDLVNAGENDMENAILVSLFWRIFASLH